MDNTTTSNCCHSCCTIAPKNNWHILTNILHQEARNRIFVLYISVQVPAIKNSIALEKSHSLLVLYKLIIYNLISCTFDALIKYERPFCLGIMKFKIETSELCPVNIFMTSFVSTSHNFILLDAVSILLLSGIAKIAVTFSLPVFHLLKQIMFTYKLCK